MKICPACDNSDFVVVPYPRDKDYLDFRSIAVCKNCGMGSVVTEKNDRDIADIYDEGEYWHDVGINSGLDLHYKTQSLFRLKSCLSHLDPSPGFSVLDIGAGRGYIFDALSELLQGKHIEYDFTEPDSKMVEEIKKRSLNKARLQNLERLTGQKKYDLIFLNHVLEHVISPIELLQTLRSLLKENGKIYIEVPNSDYKFKRNVFPHTLFFTQKSLTMILKKAGFDVISSRTFGNVTVEKRTTLQEKILNKFLTKGMAFAVRSGLTMLGSKLNEWKFGYYRNSENGLWLNALCSLEKKN